jgi:acetoin utilization deacetylase AcuC-like enzyme
LSQRVFHSPRYFADLGKHIMPIRKFQLVREAVAASGIPVALTEPEAVTDEQLLRVHSAEYLRAIATGEPRALAESQKFPWSAGLAEAVRWTNGGCIAALDAALEDGVAANLASGFHHSHADHGEGFCTFNGLVVALEHGRAQRKLTRGLVLDMDLHYGNGTASLLSRRPWAYQLSIYGNWYKANKAYADVASERAADTANAWSIPVPNGATGEQYVDILRASLGAAIDRAKPDVLLYQAGADPYEEDPYSPLKVDHEALRARDTFVFETAKAKGLPVAWVLAGGYTEDVTKVVKVHVNTFLASMAVFGTGG